MKASGNRPPAARKSGCCPSCGGDPHKIGVIGLSGGAYLVANMSNTEDLTYRLTDAAYREYPRPDFAVIADTARGFDRGQAFDSNAIMANLHARGAKEVISQHSRRRKPLPLDIEICKWRISSKYFFCQLKEFKRIATRADKTYPSFNAMIHLAAAVINSR